VSVNSSSISGSSGGTGSTINLNQSVPSPVVSGTITLSANTQGAKSVTYKVDGNTVPSAKINTTKLTDGKHTIEVLITKPNGQVVKEQKIITVNNHHSGWRNVLARYGYTRTIGAILLSLIGICGLFWYIRRTYIKVKFRAKHKTVNAANNLINNNAHNSPPPIPGTVVNPDLKYKDKD
jgi:hypothetical protein